jgi:choline monooxygenase
MIVCQHGGVEQQLKCRYHGRRFELDGTFKSMPEFEQAQNFPTKADNLPQIQLEQWGPLLFASLDPAMPFDEWFSPVAHRLAWLERVPCKFEPGHSRDYLVEANWALYCENYLEGFHIPFVHAGLNETLDFGSYRTDLYRYASVQIGFLRGAEHGFDIPATAPDHGEPIAAYYFWLFPNLMLNFYPWGISINVIKPLGVGRTRVSFLAFVTDATRLEQGAGAGLDRVEREDEAVVELVQAGVRSRLYKNGRYSPTREQGTHHFHQLLAEFLGEAE